VRLQQRNKVRTSEAHICAGDPRPIHSANCHASLPWAVHNRLARTKALPQRKTPHQKVRADFARSSCIPSTAKSRLHHFAETSQFPRVRVVKDKSPPTTFQNVVPEAREGPRRGPRTLSRDCFAPPPPPPKPVTLIGCRGDTQNRQRRVTDARNRRPTRSVSPCPPARSTSSRRSAPRSSSAPRARTCASRAPSACPPRPSRSPPARPLAVRVPRPGTATRCASTSVSSSALPLVRRRRFSVRKVLTDHCSLNAPTEVVKQIIVNIDAGVEVEVTIAA